MLLYLRSKAKKNSTYCKEEEVNQVQWTFFQWNWFRDCRGHLRSVFEFSVCKLDSISGDCEPEPFSIYRQQCAIDAALLTLNGEWSERAWLFQWWW